MDLIAFKADLEEQCLITLRDYQREPSEDTYRSAMAKLDGLYLGIMLMVRALEQDPASSETLEAAHQVVKLYQSSLMRERL